MLTECDHDAGSQTFQQHSVANGKRWNSWVDKNFIKFQHLLLLPILSFFLCLSVNLGASIRSAAPTRRLPCGAVPCTAWRRAPILAEQRFWCLGPPALFLVDLGGEESMKRRYLLKGACCVCLINGHRNPVPKKAYNAAASACSSSKWRLSTSMMQVDGWTRECLPKRAADGLVSCRKYRSCMLLLLVLLLACVFLVAVLLGINMFIFLEFGQWLLPG